MFSDQKDMKLGWILFFCVVLSGCFLKAIDSPNSSWPEPVKIEAQPKAGFKWPYFLYVPASLPYKTSTILVLPNNSGRSSDDFAVHEQDAFKKIRRFRKRAEELGVILLKPVFPRSRTEWKVYTHALDRDTMLAPRDSKIHRLDLQLISMIANARMNFKKNEIETHEKVFMLGFSASGMFTNRFTLLHPEIIKAAAFGSPGGWPIAPLEEWMGHKLRYPIGVSDLARLTGKKFNKRAFSHVPIFYFLGDQDSNDSVTFSDGYDDEDRDLIFRLFGNTPVKRWGISQEIYGKTGCNCEFNLYPGVGHEISDQGLKDILDFFRKHL